MTINMMTAQQAAERLGIKPQSLYAYVSRGLLVSTPDPRGRSLFRTSQVEQLARRGRPRAPRLNSGGMDVTLTSRISQLTARSLRYRGHDALQLTEEHGFESAAELLWTGTLQPHVRWPEAKGSGVARKLPPGTAPLERFCAVLSELSAHDPLRIDLSVARVATAGRAILQAFVAALPLLRPAQRTGKTPRLCALLWPRLSPLPATPERLALLDATLVLLADHELATSTLAARVAASARAHPFAVVAAGLAALAGPLHGKAAEQVQRVLWAARHAGPPELALAQSFSQSRLTPGFGHPVYDPEDVRACALLPRIYAMARPRERAVLRAVEQHGRTSTGKAPNVDLALGALAFACDMPLGATEALFAIARSAGFLAHALEEYGEAPLRFRARALYVGD